MTPTIILGILLAISVAGNGWQYHEAGKLQVKIGATEQLATDTKAAAEACTKGVDDLAKAGRVRGKALLEAMKGVAPKVASLEAAASVAARAKPDDPQNLCASLERYWKAQIKAEREGK